MRAATEPGAALARESLTSQSGSARCFSERSASAAPALARGVSSVSCVGAEVFAVCSIDLRTAMFGDCVFDDAPRRDAIVLVSSAHDASCRVSIAAARFLRDVAPAARSTLSRRRLYRPAISRPQFHVFQSRVLLTWIPRFSLLAKLPSNRS